jgi:hypothetical protein
MNPSMEPAGKTCLFFTPRKRNKATLLGVHNLHR